MRLPDSNIWKIDGVPIPSPSSFSLQSEHLQSSGERTTDGILHKETVRYNVVAGASFSYLEKYTGETVFSYQLRPRTLYKIIANTNEQGFVINPKYLCHTTNILTQSTPATVAEKGGKAK